MSVGQDAGQSAEDPQTLRAAGRQEVRAKPGVCPLKNHQAEIRKTHLVEGQGVVEEQVTADQSDAELEMAKHVVAAGSSQGWRGENVKYEQCDSEDPRDPELRKWRVLKMDGWMV